ncbi:hypothetical protein EXIGLDRAFT_766142 [Exidia glandulosa HHB12029]|uniref:Uncharacterized protein n=1 Tax=Exidia glandulosa HHB12029 TaxID=1314781 RepID=A0A165JZR8_EXIGL|nr:hypothetical protein EXIGLDRAFT_766142 [Exidia glandulosa HHB12029]
MDWSFLQFSRNDAKASRKTGANEEADELTHLLTDINMLIKDNADRKATTAQGRAKATMERQAGAELRDAAMRGIVDRESLVDVSTLPGATAREKSGQRKKRRRSPSSSDDDKENTAPGTSRHKRGRTGKGGRAKDDDSDIIRVLEDMNSADKELLAAAKEAQRASDAKQDAVLQKLGDLVDVLGGQHRQREDSERLREERREERREQNEDFMRMMATMFQMQRPPP